jgi:hypothetical protein
MCSPYGIGQKPYAACLKALSRPLNPRPFSTDTVSMTNPFFQMGAVFAALVMACVLTFEGREIGASMGLVEAEPEPVLVFTIPAAGAIERIRKAIPDDRILIDEGSSFALHKGRIYVQQVALAGPLINRSGWVDRPIQIVSLGMDEGEGEAGASGEGGSKMSPEQRMARMRQLVNKKSLTRGEQMFVLQAMNDGIEI